MRIAFTSCMFDHVIGNQPVWEQIDAQKPDHLVLLGDSTYFDVDITVHPQDMDAYGFAQHAFRRYVDLLAQPQFAALVHIMHPGTVHAIWDDHDFLWNDVNGADVHPVHTEKVRVSTALHEAFRVALSQSDPTSFPDTYDDPRFWDLAQAPLSTPSIVLDANLRLHLSDGRTHRTRTFLFPDPTILGAAQKDRFTLEITGAPDAVHLWASGSTVAGYQRYERDLAWLMGLAADHRLLVLSGDIHRNALDAFYTTDKPLHEATSSGAGVRKIVVAGPKLQNYGLLDIDANTVTIRLFKDGALETSRVLDRETWYPIS